MGVSLIFPVVVLVLIFGIFGFFSIYPRFVTNGKMLCVFVEGNRTAQIKLLKVRDDLVTFGADKDKYGVDGNYVRLVRYPMGWPSFFQVTVPCVIYEMGRFDPLNWLNLGEPGASSKEVGAVLDPFWLSLIVKGTKAGQLTQDKVTRILLIATTALVGVGIILMLYVVIKMGSLQGAVDRISAGP